MRLLPLLSTHLSFPEIAAEMFLSRNTVKSAVNSIYRKLGTSSRSQDEIADVLLAIAPAAGLGRIVAAAPEVAIALGYDITAVLEEAAGH